MSTNEPLLKADGIFFWCPSEDSPDKENGVAGTLEIAENGIATLSLVGLLTKGDAEELFQQPQYDPSRCIAGGLKDGRHVFLRQIASAGTTFGNMSHQKFVAREVVVFNHLETLPDLNRITKMQISLDELGDWASDPCIQVRKTRRGATARGLTSRRQTFKLADRALELKTTLRHSISGFFLHSVTIEQQTVLTVVPRKPRNLDAMRKEFLLVEDLLLLLSDVDVVLPWPLVSCGSATGRFYFARRRAAGGKVNLLESWTALHGPLKTSIGVLLSNLEMQQERLGPGLYLYMGVRRSPALYLENKFSTAVFGLESMHRRVGAGAENVRLEQKVARILADVKSDRDREWLKRKLRNAGEPSLEERLCSTFSELAIGLDSKELRAFAKECADIRNQVAHFGGQRSGEYGGFISRMRILNDAIRLLYHAVLLNRIGLDAVRIAAYFHRSPHSMARKRKLANAGLTLLMPEVLVKSGQR